MKKVYDLGENKKERRYVRFDGNALSGLKRLLTRITRRIMNIKTNIVA